MKHAFVTGASGFIGEYVVREFVAQGWHVSALIHNRPAPGLQVLAEGGAVTVVRGDVTDFVSIERALAQGTPGREHAFDAIVHCAGRASDVGWRREFRKTNFESVQHLVKLTGKRGAGRFVFVSTTDVYGLRDCSGESEDELPLADHPRNPYPKFKIAAEEWLCAELPPDRFAIVRPAAVWGAGDRTLTPRIVGFLRSSPWIVHFGKWRGGNRWPMAHVRNVAAAVFLTATTPEAGGRAINVVDSERTTVDEFYRILAGVFLPGRTFRSVVLPLWLGKAVGAAISCISNMFNMDQPFADPSLYAVSSVSSNLDFSNDRFRQLMAKAGRHVVTRDEGIRELKAARKHAENQEPDD